MGTVQADPYKGLKARMAVAVFEDKTVNPGLYRAEFGRGLSDMLTTALFQTARFIVLEREKLQAVLAEQNLGTTGRFKREGPPIGELERADIMVYAAITGFDPGVAGGSAGVGQLPGAVGSLLGGLAGSYRQARVAMDLRLIETRTGRLLAATSAEGTATSFAGDIGLTGTKLGVGLDGFAKTPMESAIREMIQKAVDFVAAKTPETFYRYLASGEPVKKK
ncbi:MAG: CsgG/HfaB family protein [Nitrospiraceae bacterium]|nr:CsgG/HfaB family protein [Nitrospiraceae bacterium]